MFENLIKYKTIIVTGPQRSGTRITSKAIAADTGHIYIEEEKYFRKIKGQRFAVVDLSKLEEFKTQAKAIHGPMLLSHWQELNSLDTIFVCCIRKLLDLKKSEKRLKHSYWTTIPETMEYINLMGFNVKPIPLPFIKYTYWLTQVRHKVYHWMEFCYEDLKSHPMWQSSHAHFKWNQTE